MRLIVGLFFIHIIAAHAADAAVLELKGGDRISGEVIAEDATSITIQPSYSAALTIDKAQIVQANFAQAQAQAPVAQLVTEPEPAPSSEAAEEPSPTWEHEGRISFGLDVEDGNNQSRDMNVDVDQEWESDKHRYTLKFDYEYGEERSVRTDEEGRLYGQYDYRLDPQRYLFTNLTMLRDIFQDIRLRSSLGAGYGYEWFVEKTYELRTEIGLNYVHEDLDVDPTDSFAALRWELEGEYNLSRPELVLFGELEGLISLEEAEDMSARGKSGVRMPVLKGWMAELAWHLDWENQAASNAESLDSRYVVGLVYEW